MPVPRDTLRFVAGRGRYVDDLHLDGMLFLKLVRSPYARARIVKVRGGIGGAEFKANLTAVGEGAWGGGPPTAPYPALASDYVSFVGQPVAAVFDEDPYRAEDLAEEVQVDYDPLKPLVDPEEAFTFEPIHPGTRSNVVNRVQLGQDFSEDAPVVLEDEFVNERICPNSMEPRGLVTHYDGSRLTVWASTQSVHTWKSGICSAVQLPKEKVRVIQMDTGGAFGLKSGLYPEYAVASYVSMKTGRPVKWVETRSEHLQVAGQGRGANGKVKFFAERNGRVLGVKADVLIDSGAFALGIAVFAPRFMANQITGPYAIGKAFVTATSVYTNKAPYGPYRGQGRPESAFFYERMMDLLADELKMDPVEVRLRNASPNPFVSPLGLKIEAFQPFLRTAVSQLGYAKRSKNGFGFSSFVLTSAVQPGESCRIAIRGGRVLVWLGGSEGGQDFEVMVRVILSEELGIPKEVIELEPGDTDELDQGIGTWGSRTAIVATGALVEAASKIKEAARSKLGGLVPGELLRHEFDVTVFHRENEQANSFGANLVKASLDRETGEARVEQCLAYYDVGRALNPYMVESQIIGGSAQGIGQVLYETAEYSDEGQPLVGGLGDSGLVHASAMPPVTVRLAGQTASSPQRVKGVGEASTIGVPPALVRSLEGILGRRIRRTPMRPEDLRALP
jgi:carbon-monoxide dehydrogenase large subunit